MSTATKSVKQISFGGLFTTILTTQLKSLFKSKKTIVLAVVNLLPLVGAILYASVDESKSGLDFYKSMIEYVSITFMLPLTAMFYGGPSVVEEIEGRTITYLFLRPVSKPAIFLGKYAAAAIVTLVVVVLPTIPMFFVALTAGDGPGEHYPLFVQTLMSLVVGAFAYTAIFSALSAMFATSMLPSILYWGAMEWGLSFVPVLEIGTQKYHCRNVASLIDIGNLGMLDRMVGLEKPVEVPIAASYSVMIGFTILVLAVGAYVFNRRQYVI